MRRAIDTNVLVYAHLPSMAEHDRARRYVEAELGRDDVTLVVTPAVLHELVHVITDPRRFDPPVSMPEALAVAQSYLGSANVECIATDATSAVLAFELLARHGLGRKRLADTLFAATLLTHGVHEIITSNRRDFEIFEGIYTIDPMAP
jgi:toxin-antitoxin system PIN domain toxin